MATQPAARGMPHPRTRSWPLLLPIGVFLALLVAVRVNAVVPSADEAFRAWVHAHQRPAVARLSLALTQIGSPWASVIVLLLVAVAMAKRRGNLGPILLAAIGVCAVAGTVLPIKALVARPGPGLMHRHVATGYFPSGHTATAFVCYGAMGVLVRLGDPRGRRLEPLLWGWGAALPVGAAMVYSDFHWLSDVLASFALGAALVWLLVNAAPHLVPHGGSAPRGSWTILRPRPPARSSVRPES